MNHNGFCIEEFNPFRIFCNLLAQILNEEAMVEFATVKNAVTNEIKREAPPVTEQEPAQEESTEIPAEEAPTEGVEPQKPASEGENEGEGEAEEEKEPLYNVTAQIIVYLTIAAKEG